MPARLPNWIRRTENSSHDDCNTTTKDNQTSHIMPDQRNYLARQDAQGESGRREALSILVARDGDCQGCSGDSNVISTELISQWLLRDCF